MDVRSLGYRTDLALLRYGGSEIEDRGDHVVIRSPDNPTFWWGNFVLVDQPPAAGPEVAQRWLDVFAEAFPDAAHLAIGVDGAAGTRADLAGFVELGLSADVSAVMTAQSVCKPPHPNRDASYRPLASDQDWADLVELAVAVEERHDKASYRVFAEGRARTARQLTEAGYGAWFGAFVDGRLLSSMGLVRADEELARFQSVETHPEARGRGLAGTLVHHVSEYGFQTLGVQTLVMVADPQYLAIRLYRALGFESTESQLGVDRSPD
ncbi:MAG: GNAT family N-acetyltransferase [Nocardioidaceae bacterium]